MMKDRTFLLSRIAIVVILYPWLVGFNIPHDSLTHKITVYGGTGQYDVIHRDCNGRILSVLEVPFSEGAAVLEGQITEGVGYKIRGGYVNSASSEKLFRGNTTTYDSTGNQFGYRGNDCIYGGGTLRLSSSFVGLEFSGFAADRVLAFSVRDANYAFGGGLRIGRLDSWYWTFNLFNDDPLLSRTWGSSGFGFSLNSTDYVPKHMAPPSLWLGFGAGVFDGPMLLMKVDYPFSKSWSGDFSGTVSMASNIEGAVSVGLGYAW